MFMGANRLGDYKTAFRNTSTFPGVLVDLGGPDCLSHLQYPQTGAPTEQSIFDLEHAILNCRQSEHLV